MSVSDVLGIGGFGTIFLGIGTFGLLKARRLRGRGVTTEAVVVALHETLAPGAGGASAQHSRQPVLMFTTREGRQVQVESPVGASNSYLLPGYTVTVHYDPHDPEKVSVPENENGVYRLFVGIGVLVLGLMAGSGIFGPPFVNAALFAIPLFVGAVFTGIGCFGISRTWPIKHGGTADGVVVGAITTKGNSGFPVHHPVIRYVASNGATYEVPTTEGRLARAPAPGTPIRIRYDRAKPHRIMLPGQTAPPIFWIFGTVGILIMIIGIVVIVAALW